MSDDENDPQKNVRVFEEKKRQCEEFLNTTTTTIEGKILRIFFRFLNLGNQNEYSIYVSINETYFYASIMVTFL